LLLLPAFHMFCGPFYKNPLLLLYYWQYSQKANNCQYIFFERLICSEKPGS
jgi:hypothetical protein